MEQHASLLFFFLLWCPKARDERKEKDKVSDIKTESKAVFLSTSNSKEALRMGQGEDR